MLDLINGERKFETFSTPSLPLSLSPLKREKNKTYTILKVKKNEFPQEISFLTIFFANYHQIDNHPPEA